MRLSYFLQEQSSIHKSNLQLSCSRLKVKRSSNSNSMGIKNASWTKIPLPVVNGTIKTLKMHELRLTKNISLLPYISQRLIHFQTNEKDKYLQPWHHPLFMKDSQPEEIEAWLLSLLESEGNIKNGIKMSSSVELQKHFKEHFVVDATAYLKVLDTYAKSKISGAPQKVEYWIGRLERHFDDSIKAVTSAYATPDGKFNILSSPFSFGISEARHQKQPRSSQRNHDTINISYNDVASYIRNLQPTVECYNAVIEAWGNANDLISVVRSRRWLSKLEDEAKKSRPLFSNLLLQIQPNSRSYDLYLHSCSRGIGKQQKLLLKQRAEEAEQILLYRMSPQAMPSIRPSTDSFNCVIRAWTRCRKEISVAERVMSLVREMERRQKEMQITSKSDKALIEENLSWRWKIAPNTKTYSMAIDAWTIVAGLKAEHCYKQLAHNNMSIHRKRHRNETSCYDLGTKRRNKDNTMDDGNSEMENAESILKYMHSLEDLGDRDIHVSVIEYNTLLTGWGKLANCKRPDIPLKCEKILFQMIQLYENDFQAVVPNVQSFNAVIKAWSKTTRSNSAARCEWWLRKMITANADDKASFIPRPSSETYNLVMEAWFYLGDPARVEVLMREMDSSDFIRPNSQSFSIVIRSWLHDELHSQHLGLYGMSFDNALKWLKELLIREKEGDPDLSVGPDLFLSLLKTGAKTKSCGENILSGGEWTFWALRESRFEANALAYEWLLEIALKVLSTTEHEKKRQDFVANLFQMCCEDGLLSKKFASLLMSSEVDALSKNAKDLLRKPPFPTTWCRNLALGST